MIVVFSQVSRLIISFDWLRSFNFVLAVSYLRSFQQVCFLHKDELFQANLPVTKLHPLQTNR